MKNTKSPLGIACDVIKEIDNCMYDLANGDEIEADRMHNDPDVMSDMFGDRFFEACNLMKTDEDKVLAWGSF